MSEAAIEFHGLSTRFGKVEAVRDLSFSVQRGRVTGLIGVSHRYDPAATGPEGVPIDWHVVRVLFRVAVDRPTEAVVTEAAGGSTAAAGWFTPGQAAELRLTEIARTAVRGL